MKPQLALILLTLAACREQPEQKATPPDRLPARPSPSASTPAQDTRPNKPLLKTPRITITDTGSGRFYPVIRDAAQAEATLADIRSLPPSAARDSATAGIIGDLAKVDPAAARRLFEAWDGGLIEAWLDAAETIARELGKSDPEAAASFIRDSIPAPANLGVWAQFLVILPPADRVAHIESLPEGSEKIRIAGDLVHVWLAEDPAACARWLDGFVQGRDPDELRELTTSVHNSFAPDADTAHRLTALRTATDPRLRELLAEYLWKKADAAERAELFTEIEQDIPDLAQRDRQSAIAAAPAAFAASLSPAQAAELPTDEMKVIIERWAATQPAAAFRWALDHQRPEAALALDPLYREEPRQALELAAQLKPGKERDTALASLCAAAAFHGHADLARPLLPLIENPAQREATTRNVEEHAGKAAR
jgi:hypothetical protein